MDIQEDRNFSYIKILEIDFKKDKIIKRLNFIVLFYVLKCYFLQGYFQNVRNFRDQFNIMVLQMRILRFGLEMGIKKRRG